MSYGVVEYDEIGNPKCEICDKYFSRVLSHVRQTHEMNEREYKTMFGFDLKKGICSLKSSEKTRTKTLLNFEKCIKINLQIKGVGNRFEKGCRGRTIEKVSEQTRVFLKERLKEPYMVEAMKLSGTNVGKSGLGNKKRWEK